MNNDLEILCGTLEGTPRPLKPFDARVVDFLSDWGAALMKTPAARPYPDVITFAFFLRRAHLQALAAPYGEELTHRVGLGRGFHIAPGNVAMNFAYSLVAALLAGNACLVKAPSRDFPQVGLTVAAAATLLNGEYADLAPYVCVARYPRENQTLTEKFSGECDVRIIWGGDETIRRVRQAPLLPHAFDITFPDRWSLLMAGAEGVLSLSDEEMARVAAGFYNDTYLTDQNACTSPRVVYWLGAKEAVAAAKERFWAAVHENASRRYTVPGVMAVDKLTAACHAALAIPGSMVEKARDSLICRLSIPAWTKEAEGGRCAGGFFLEYASETMDALRDMDSRRLQTVTCVGVDVESVRGFVLQNGLKGIDRVVPLGHSMDFSLFWDGRDLIRSMSRLIGASQGGM